MNEEQSPKAGKAPTARPIVLWSAAIIAALGLAWLATWLVVSLRRTHEVVTCVQLTAVSSVGEDYYLTALWPDAAVESLGGRDKATRKLAIYLWWPERIAPFKNKDAHKAVSLLGYCGPAAVGHLTRLVDDPYQGKRFTAIEALGHIGPDAKPAIPALIKALGEGDGSLCWRACRTLGEIGPAAKEAVPLMEKALAKEKEYLFRVEISEALRKVRGETLTAPYAP